jgi:hypothetical protein
MPSVITSSKAVLTMADEMFSAAKQVQTQPKFAAIADYVELVIARNALSQQLFVVPHRNDTDGRIRAVKQKEYFRKALNTLRRRLLDCPYTMTHERNLLLALRTPEAQ